MQRELPRFQDGPFSVLIAEIDHKHIYYVFQRFSAVVFSIHVSSLFRKRI